MANSPIEMRQGRVKEPATLDDDLYNPDSDVDELVPELDAISGEDLL